MRSYNRVHAVYFSPVRNTKDLVTFLATQIGTLLDIPVTEDDFTLPSARDHQRSYQPDELVIFGVPTYAGRIPNKILPSVQTLFQGQDTPAVCVVTFGNRAYDEAPKELCLELKKNGFIPFAAGAFAGPHVMSDVLGAGRPDDADLEKRQALAHLAADRLRGAADAAALKANAPFSGEETVGPYYRPLEEDGTPADFLKAKPVTDMEKCDRCGICAKVCPMGSIDPEDITKTPGICIKCHACICKCPTGAKYFDSASLQSHIRMLEAHFAGRRAEAEIFG